MTEAILRDMHGRNGFFSGFRISFRQFRCVSVTMSWDQEFEDPVTLPNGKVIWTLREAGEYVAKLSEKEADYERWQTAMAALLQAAEKRGPIMHAHIGMMRALQKDMPPAAPSERTDKPWGRRPLKRDK